MRVSAISVNYAQTKNNVKTRKALRNNENTQEFQTEQPFRGLKGAAIGTGYGLGYIAACSLMCGPFLPVTATLVGLSAAAGALSGHVLEEELNKNNKNGKNGKNDNNDND